MDNDFRPRTDKETGNSIKRKMFWVMAIQIIICITIMALLIVMQVYENYGVCLQRGRQSASQIIYQLKNEIEKVVEMTKIPLYEYNSRKSFILSALRENHLSKEFCEEYYSFAKAYLNEDDFLDNIALFWTDGHGLSAYKAKDIYRFEDVDSEASWFTDTMIKKGSALVLMPGEYTISKYVKSEKMIMITRAIRTIYKYKFADFGLIAIRINTDLMKEAFKEYKQFENQEYAIFYKDVIAFGDYASDMDFSSFPLLEDNENRDFIRKNNDRLYIYNYYKRDNLLVAIRTPITDIFKGVKLVSLPFGIIGIILLFTLTAIIYNLLQNVLRPLKSLVSACDATNGTFFSYVQETNIPNELKHLFTSFNSMNTRIDNLVNEGLRKDLSKKEIELQLLRTQINPHYLYNTLEFIHMQAFTNKDFDVARIAELLGENLQYGLRNTGNKVLLKEEVLQANKYMELISYHYKDQIIYKNHIDRSLFTCITIKLIFQPLLENAVTHGKIAGKKLSIEILGFKDDNDIVFTVFDDGKHIEQNTLREIEEKLKDPERTQDSIGLYNVHRRLVLNYGPEYGVSLKSVENQGTAVIIRMPYYV